MKTDWCVLRISLFPGDFSLSTATPAERARFEAAITNANGGLSLAAGERDEDAAASLARYEARARLRSDPRSLFAAAALGLPDGAPASLKDVDVEIVDNHEALRLAEAPPAADADLWLAPECVLHAGGATVYRYDGAREEFRRVGVAMPPALRDVLGANPKGAPRSAWDERFAAAGIKAPKGESIVESLIKAGVLRPRSSPIVFNGSEQPRNVTLDEVIRRSERPSSTARSPAGAAQTNVFSTFRRPIAMPKALVTSAREVARRLVSWANPARSAAPAVLFQWADGRWIPLPELERMAEGILKEAALRDQAEVAEGEPAFVDWIRSRALDEEIDLTKAPEVRQRWSGDILLHTEWTADGRLIEPQIFAGSPREMLGRYSAPGISDRLTELDPPGAVLLAYHGPAMLGDIGEVHAPGMRVLDYCGRGSDPSKALRIEDIEVTSTGHELLFRTRGERELIKIIPAVPFHESFPSLHPFVQLLVLEARSERPLLQMFKRALQDFPVRPRLVYKGHILRRRRAVVPGDLKPNDFTAWLRRTGLGGDLCVEINRYRLPLDSKVDGPVQRELFKQLRAGKGVMISELCSPAGIDVDGRSHNAHALMPIHVGAAPKPPERLSVPGPSTSSELRGPFMTLRARALAERLPSVLRALGGVLGNARSFYVVLPETLDCDLRLRVPAADRDLQCALLERAGDLLDRRQIRSFALEPYMREWDRYGGITDIAAVEGYFVSDSASLLEASASLSALDPRRSDLYTLCVLQTLALFSSDDEAEDFCKRGFDALIGSLKLSSPTLKSIGRRWRARMDAILAAARGGGDRIIRNALTRRSARLSEWLAEEGNPARLARHARSLIHMTGTRLHFQENRFEEACAFSLGRRLLGALRHQGGLSEVLTSLTAAPTTLSV